MREREREREATGFDLEAAEARSRGGGDWVMVGRSSCGGLLDMGREKKGRSVTWVAQGGREKQGRSTVRGTAQMAVESISSSDDGPFSL